MMQLSKINFWQVIFWIQGEHAIIHYFGHKKKLSNQFIHFIPIPKPIVYIIKFEEV